MKLTKICAALLLVLLLTHPRNAYATPDGWFYRPQIIYVNQQRFEVWGYLCSFREDYFRLRDIAYILNGTSAQFNIREPYGDNLHFWIERNVPYIPIGTELTYFYEEDSEWWRSLGGFHAYATEHFPIQNVILSLDGAEAPDESTVVAVLTPFGFPLNYLEWLTDIYLVSFSLESLAGVLGFSVMTVYDDTAIGTTHIITGDEYFADINAQSLEWLDMALRLTGHWVDRRFFDDNVITQDVAWPHEFNISIWGLTYAARFVDYAFTGVPLAARQPNVWDQDAKLYPFILESFNDGTAIFALDGSDRRIRAERSLPTNSLFYYFDGIPIEMVRLDPALNPGRYSFEVLECGGLRISYIADYQLFWHSHVYIHVYRSTEYGYEGERIFSHAIAGMDERIFFEFIDQYPPAGVHLFYTIKAENSRQRYDTITFGGARQITAFVEVEDEEVAAIEVIDEFEPPEHAIDILEESRRNRVVVLFCGFVVIVLGTVFLKKGRPQT